MTAVLARMAPGAAVIDLFADAPAHDPELAAYLLAAYVGEFPPPAVFLCVVDPGVGSARRAVAAEIDGRWFVGPDNGLFEIVIRRAKAARRWDIDWRPETLSASFHGRDLFAPVAAMLARGDAPPGTERPVAEIRRPEWPDDLARIVYFDAFGNAMTGLRASVIGEDETLALASRPIPRARVFSDVPKGSVFWYANSNGLAEIAVNRGSARDSLELDLGTRVALLKT